MNTVLQLAALACLGYLIYQGKTIMSALDTLRTEVSETKTVMASAVALLRGLKARLDAAIASGDPAALQALADDLDSDTNALASAVTENTPADPTPTP